MLLGVIGCGRSQQWSPSGPAAELPVSSSSPASGVSAQSAGSVSSGAVIADAAVETDATVAEKRLRVHLVPVGEVSREMLEQVTAGLRDHAPVDPVLESAQPLPREARTNEKDRYRAAKILDWLATLAIDPDGKIIGISEIDLVERKGSIPNWGILGLGSLDGRCSVLSTWRMKRKWENGGAPDWLVRERLWKTAIHELGHTLGLEHCPKVGCLMEDGHGTVKTTDRETALCDDCAHKFLQAIRRNSP